MKNQKDLYCPGNFLETLKLCRCHYKKTSKEAPLVAYAATYNNPTDGCKKHYVGFEYFNCSQLEQFPTVLRAVVKDFRNAWKGDIPDVVLGAPMGGILFSFALAEAFGCRHVFAEKVVTEKAVDADHVDNTKLVFNRNEVKPEEKVLLCEDVCHNFSTTKKLMDLVSSSRGVVSAIACLINRSSRIILEIDQCIIPVRSLAHIPTRQYSQEDPAVSQDVKDGNVVWNPKKSLNWSFLMKTISPK